MNKNAIILLKYFLFKKTNILLLAVFFIFLLLIGISCKDYNDDCKVTSNSGYSFQSVSAKVGTCKSCHVKGNALNAGFDITDYAQVKEQVTCDAETSPLYNIITSGGMLEYSSADINSEIKNWINSGAVKGTSAACKDYNSTYSFETLFAKVEKNCLGCHNSNTPLSIGVGFDISSYQDVKAQIICGDPNNSLLYQIITDGAMAIYANDDIVKEVKNWIQNGGAKNGGSPLCGKEDNSRYSFTTISTVIERKCANCHSSNLAATLGAGFDITDYTAVKKQIVCGSPDDSPLYNIINKGPMKDYADADILDEINNWILTGAARSGGIERCALALDSSIASYETVRAAQPGSCNTCHSSTSADSSGGGFDLSDYAQVKERISCNTDTSPFYQVLTNSWMTNFLSNSDDILQDNYVLEVKKWIEAGGAEKTGD